MQGQNQVLIIKSNLAGSRQQVQLDVRIGQTVEIHRLQTLIETEADEDMRQGHKIIGGQHCASCQQQ